jgi:hypothetical protein
VAARGNHLHCEVKRLLKPSAITQARARSTATIEVEYSVSCPTTRSHTHPGMVVSHTHKRVSHGYETTHTHTTHRRLHRIGEAILGH